MLEPIKLLYSVKNTEIELDPTKPKAMKDRDVAYNALRRMINGNPTMRIGLITEVDNKYYFREGKRGQPITIGKYTTDGYDYVFEYYGRLYITHSCASLVMATYRMDLLDADEETLSEITKKYRNYLKTLL